MRISRALADLWAGTTQVAVAARLTEAGLPVVQPTVSAWLRGRQPSLAHLNVMETAFGKPKGWVLERAGFVDPIGLLRIKRPAGELVELIAEAERLLAELTAANEEAAPAPRARGRAGRAPAR